MAIAANCDRFALVIIPQKNKSLFRLDQSIKLSINFASAHLIRLLMAHFLP